MAESCEMLENCGFFKKYRKLNYFACDEFIRLYCRGDRQNECIRKKYRKEHNAPPPDNMLPNGKTTGMTPLEA